MILHTPKRRSAAVLYAKEVSTNHAKEFTVIAFALPDTREPAKPNVIGPYSAICTLTAEQKFIRAD